MLEQLHSIWAELFGHSSVLAQVAFMLFVVSLVLLLLSLVSFQLSRIRQREPLQERPIKASPTADHPHRNRPIVRVSWGQVEDDFYKNAPDINLAKADMPEEKLPEEFHEETATAFPQENQMASSGMATGNTPLNVTYLNRNISNNAGSMQTKTETNPAGKRIGPLVFNPQSPDANTSSSAEDSAEKNADNLEGFIFKQRQRKPVAEASPHVSSDDSEDRILVSLGNIEDRMKELKQTYHAGQISSELYADQCRKLYEEAQQLMTKL